MDPGFYGVAAVDAPVGVGVTGSRFCTLQGVVKTAPTVKAAPTDAGDTASVNAAYTVANEYVASRIAGLLGLPVPPGTIVELDDGTVAFAMMKFGKKGDKPPPVDAHDFVEKRPRLAAGIVLFDAWILNADRHHGNLAWYPDGHGSAAIFDHGHALFGIHDGKGVEHLEAAANDPCLGFGCLISELSEVSDLESWVEQIRAVRDLAIKDICQPLAGLGVCTRAESVKLEEVLISRRNALRSLVLGAHDKFTKIKDTDWGLNL